MGSIVFGVVAVLVCAVGAYEFRRLLLRVNRVERKMDLPPIEEDPSIPEHEKP